MSTGLGATIDAGGLSRAFRVTAGGHLSLHRVHVVNGAATLGGGIFLSAGCSATLDGSSLQDCTSAVGGAIALFDPSLSAVQLEESTPVGNGPFCFDTTSDGSLFVIGADQ